MDNIVDQAFQELLDCYLASNHRKKVDIITKAFHFARQAHAGVKRLSGEPYIMHPITVAMIACKEMGLGSTSICAALLHDVVEDTDYTVEDLENLFGAKIAQIVDGLTKISGGIFGERASAQAENFKKLLLTMSDDIRVILIKICDRLHNMRTLASQPANKQYKIAGETLYIYAPLANRLGLNKIKTELEDLSFRYEHPEEYARIKALLAESQAKHESIFAEFTEPIKQTLNEMGVKFELKARIKSPYSIWHKMQTKHVTFEQIYDILAVRVIFTPNKREEEVNECFNIYVAISKLYKSHPDRLRDWLSHPKANGYQALHVTLMSHMGQWIEVQIRSDRMNEMAEQGFAAHWRYKDESGELINEKKAVSAENIEEDTELNKWLLTIKEILDDPQPDAMDFLDAIKLNLFASEIFVFTPKGEIKTMPANCTALDFAFSIHTFIGSHCIGAKVNHKLVPLSHVLQSGDQVEILTSNSQHVKESWISFVSTAKARNKIQGILRREAREQQKRGEQILTEFLREHGHDISTVTVEKLCALHGKDKHENLLMEIGNGAIVLGESDVKAVNSEKSIVASTKSGGKSWKDYVPFLGKKKSAAIKKQDYIIVGEDFNRKKPVYITDQNISQFIFPKCCHVIPGDDALGFIDRNNHIVIHKRDCSIANKLKASYGNRIIDIKWDMHQQHTFTGAITLTGIDRVGMIHDIADIVSDKMNINITKLLITVNDENLFEGTIEFRVHDRDDLKHIIKELKAIQGVQEVKQK